MNPAVAVAAAVIITAILATTMTTTTTITTNSIFLFLYTYLTRHPSPSIYAAATSSAIDQISLLLLSSSSLIISSHLDPFFFPFASRFYCFSCRYHFLKNNNNIIKSVSSHTHLTGSYLRISLAVF